MKVALIQANIIWADYRSNVEHLNKLIDENPGADLYVLPEMFSTGFTTDPEGIAETENYSLIWMTEKARQINAALCGSVAVGIDGNYFNRCYFVKPDDNVVYYDKRHLFTYGKEHLKYRQGNVRVVTEWMGVRILLQTCYDLRFPVFSRNKSDYDMALYVASWPERRHDVWTTLLRARAIENQCYVAGVNRVGNDLQCHYLGGSAIINPYGKYMANCEDDAESTCIADIDMDSLNSFRSKFPVLDDADQFNIV